MPRNQFFTLALLLAAACKTSSPQETRAVPTTHEPTEQSSASPAPSPATTSPAPGDAVVDRLLARHLQAPDDPAAESEAAGLEFTGLRLHAPARAGGDLQLAYLRTADALRDWQVAFRTNAKLVSVDLERGDVRCAWLFGTGKRIDARSLATSRSGPEPQGAARSDRSTELRSVDAAPLLGDLQPAGAAVFTLLDFDAASNTAVTTFGAGAGGPGFERARAEALVRGDRSRFARAPGTPALDRDGAALAFTADAKAGPVARIAVRMPLPAQALVAGWTAKDRDVPAAVVRAALIVLLLDDTGPIVVDLELPVFADRPLAAGTPVEALLNAPLRQLAPGVSANAEAVAYLVAGRHVDGPRRWK